MKNVPPWRRKKVDFEYFADYALIEHREEHGFVSKEFLAHMREEYQQYCDDIDAGKYDAYDFQEVLHSLQSQRERTAK